MVATKPSMVVSIDTTEYTPPVCLELGSLIGGIEYGLRDLSSAAPDYTEVADLDEESFIEIIEPEDQETIVMAVRG